MISQASSSNISALDALLEAAANSRVPPPGRLSSEPSLPIASRTAAPNPVAPTASSLRAYEPLGNVMPMMHREDPVIEMDDGRDPSRGVDEKSRSLPSLSSFFL